MSRKPPPRRGTASAAKKLTHTADHTMRRRSTVTVAHHGHHFEAGKSISAAHHGKLLYEASRKGTILEVTDILEQGTLPDEYKDRVSEDISWIQVDITILTHQNASPITLTDGYCVQDGMTALHQGEPL